MTHFDWGSYDPNYFDAGWVVWAVCSVALILRYFLGREGR